MANFDVTRSLQKKNELTILNSLHYINNCLEIQKSTHVNFNNSGDLHDGERDTKKIGLLDFHPRILKREVTPIHEAIDFLTLMIDSIKRIKEILIEMRIKVLEAFSDNTGTEQSKLIYDLLKHYLSQMDEIADETQITMRNKIRKLDTNLLIEILTISTENELSTDFFTHPFDTIFKCNDNINISIENINFEYVSEGIAVIDAAINATDSGISNITELRSHLIFKQETLPPPRNNVGIIDDSIMNDEIAQEKLQLSKSMILNQTSMAVLVHTNMASLLFRTVKN